jgi:hypothetical protein
MNLNDLANLGQIIGAVAVVISFSMSPRKFGKTPTLSAPPPHRRYTSTFQIGTI